MEINDINHTFITLHASLGNFREIDVEDLTKHKTDSEQLIVGEEACQIINTTQDKKRRICALGTTVMRALETAVCTEGHVKTYDGWTNKFIFPPYDFTVANAMVANFYAPESQLLMMTAAFGGFENVMNAYDVAVKEGYRFIGWYDGIYKCNENTIINSSLSLVAKYEKIIPEIKIGDNVKIVGKYAKKSTDNIAHYDGE